MRIANLITFIVAFSVVYLLSPVVQKYAVKIGFVDRPNPRKIHKLPIPLLGGLALYAGFAITVLFTGHPTSTGLQWAMPSLEIGGILIGGLLILAIGVVDDYAKTRGKDFPIWPRLGVQFAAAGILVACGVKIQGVNIPFGPTAYYTFAPWLSVVTTILWVVVLTNMLNFLDGVDGLTAGISSISAMTLFFIALLKGQPVMEGLAVALIGISLGFLRHNFHPARIFMGDAGATFLGFTLAAISADGAFKSATLVSVFVPVLALGVPIFDTLFALFRRMRDRRPLHVSDTSHTHHRLMQSGLNQVQTVTFMYLIGICFSLASIVVLLVQK